MTTANLSARAARHLAYAREYAGKDGLVTFDSTQHSMRTVDALERRGLIEVVQAKVLSETWEGFTVDTAVRVYRVVG